MPACPTHWDPKLNLLLLFTLGSSQEGSTTPEELPRQANQELLPLLDCCLERSRLIHLLRFPCKPARPAGCVPHQPDLRSSSLTVCMLLSDTHAWDA